ncbi:hypothetical protein MRB53_001391 [Persea americana]|uniref:Uncharacterized protein n=1 Tax=Persea americana TaxID=3435 RepID=A0ACC2MRV5_PERAE|nr:hypothetical protein MRB53_001391 [Persea americana]
MASVLPQFEGAVETGNIKKAALRNWVVKVYLERKSLAHSLNECYQNSCKTIKQTCDRDSDHSDHYHLAACDGVCKHQVIIMHPFDVGDRCVVDGVQMIVEEKNILTTVFLRYDNEKIYCPNATLATKPISNFYRSPDMSDSVEFSVDVSTSMESIGALKERDKNAHREQSSTLPTMFVAKEIENMNKMKMALFVRHTINHQDKGEKTNRRSELIFELKKLFEELKIKYHLLPQEVHLSYASYCHV